MKQYMLGTMIFNRIFEIILSDARHLSSSIVLN